jgi:prepilin-type processing-associated H-X9-DG protein
MSTKSARGSEHVTTRVWKSALLQAVLLLLFAMLPAVLTARLNLRWTAPAEFTPIPPTLAHSDAANILFVDVRNQDRFESGHAPGALAIRPETYETMKDSIRALWRGQRIVIYGEGAGSDRALQVARKLRKDLDVPRILLLEGGWAAWPRN